MTCGFYGGRRFLLITAFGNLNGAGRSLREAELLYIYTVYANARNIKQETSDTECPLMLGITLYWLGGVRHVAKRPLY
jgi:hypothetical protein